MRFHDLLLQQLKGGSVFLCVAGALRLRVLHQHIQQLQGGLQLELQLGIFGTQIVQLGLLLTGSVMDRLLLG